MFLGCIRNKHTVQPSITWHTIKGMMMLSLIKIPAHYERKKEKKKNWVENGRDPTMN